MSDDLREQLARLLLKWVGEWRYQVVDEIASFIEAAGYRSPKVIQIGGEMKYIVVILASLVVGMLLALIVSGG
jgi:hypothetical protein